jgi:hypothetical protein
MYVPNDEWLPLNKQVYARAGVYAVRLVSKGGRPRPIRRFLDRDGEGILCIGQSSNLEKRRTQFINGVLKRVGHSEGNLLSIISEHAHRRSELEGGISTLHWCIQYCPPRKTLEEKLIKNYVRRFGEAPPLNSVIPNRYGDW